MNRTQTMPAPKSASAAPVCRTVPLQRLPGAERRELAACKLPVQDSAETLTAAFRAAPQFSQIPLDKILARKGGDGLRMVLLGENDYYLRQAAVYLTAMARKSAQTKKAAPADDFWGDLDLGDYFQDDEPSLNERLKDSLVVVNPALLDPAIGHGSSVPGKPGAMAQMMGEQKQVSLTDLTSAGVLIAADSGKVLSETLLGKVEAFLEQEDAQDLFIALKGSQVELDLLEELRFTHGFQTCRVGQADQAYLRRLLMQLAKDLLLPLSPTADLDQVIAQLRRYRGPAFTESDLEQLLQRTVEHIGKRPADTADLLFRPCRAQGSQGREALNAMVGLSCVKDSLHRLLAAAALEDRRRMSGVEIPPACRNLAFAGPPGTGKSVTARLAAQILREEGCGSGRFVEAGREQLIGPYMGQTSPMIAELFRQARGGVLFIDEAGALLTHDGHDDYAVEAVNALVRHMELEPETMVIFATYPEEMKQLLSSNPGLSSRVAQVLHFPEYGESELFDIFRTFTSRERLALPEQAADICADFFRKLKARKGKDFGNGREARRLFQAAKEEMALRALTDASVESDLSEADLRRAAERLLEQEQDKTAMKPIGFGR